MKIGNWKLEIGKRMRIAALIVAAGILARCQECPAQMNVYLAPTNQGAEVTLTNFTPAMAITNSAAVGLVPLLVTLDNLGPGDLRYTWGPTNGTAHWLRAGGTVSAGPATMIGDVIFWWLATTTNAHAVIRRDFRKPDGATMPAPTQQ